MPDYQAPRGMADVLAPDSARWAELVATFATLAARAGFELALTPLIEHVEVFQRVGDSTDIVRKEMYDFEDKGGRRIAVRPEITAGLMRAYAEHRPPAPWKAWTVGQNFRYESPQAGRYRQHHQVDAEIVGTDDPDADVEVIALLDAFHRALGLRQRTLRINTLGDADTRPAYAEALRRHFVARPELSAQSRETLALNPLRVLDSKRAEDQEAIATAPVLAEFVSDDAAAHFERVLAGLRALDIVYEVDPKLVRGLDYYTHTTFEVASHALSGAQDAIGGGGRYNGLVEAVGGPAGTGGVGFGAGIERILLACDAEGVFPIPQQRIDVFVVDTTGRGVATTLAHELRAAGWRVDRAFDGRSMKSQMKAADRSGAAVAVIVGSDELAAGTASLRPLRGGEQETIPREKLLLRLSELLAP